MSQRKTFLYYASAKGETRRVVRETEKHRILYFSVQMKLNDVEGAHHCPLCNKQSVQDVDGCDNCMEWCLTKEPKLKTWFCGYCDLKPYKNIVEFVIKVISSCTLIYVSMEQIAQTRTIQPRAIHSDRSFQPSLCIPAGPSGVSEQIACYTGSTLMFLLQMAIQVILSSVQQSAFATWTEAVVVVFSLVSIKISLTISTGMHL